MKWEHHLTLAEQQYQILQRYFFGSNSIDENSSGQTNVGSLTTTDAVMGSHTYSLVSGSGSTDNSLFEINGTNLRTKSSTTLNYESKNSYSVRIRTTDPVESNLTFEKQFTISITDVATTPVSSDVSAATLANIQLILH